MKVENLTPQDCIVLLCSTMYNKHRKDDCVSSVEGIFNTQEDFDKYLKKWGYTGKHFDDGLWCGEEDEDHEACWLTAKVVKRPEQ